MTDQGWDLVVVPTTTRVLFEPPEAPARITLRARPAMPVWTEQLIPPGEPERTMEVQSDQPLRILVQREPDGWIRVRVGCWSDEESGPDS
jgi:hypothetical protein